MHRSPLDTLFIGLCVVLGMAGFSLMVWAALTNRWWLVLLLK